MKINDYKSIIIAGALAVLNAFVFYSSFFTMFSLLIPISLMLKYGRHELYINLSISLIVVLLSGGLVPMYAFFMFVFFIAVVICELIHNFNSLKKIYLYSLYLVFGSFFVAVIGFLTIENVSYLEFFTKKLNNFVNIFERQYPELFKQFIVEYELGIEELINQFLINLPGTFIIAISIYILINIFLASRFSPVLQAGFSLKKVASLELDYKFVWPALFSGAMFLLAKSEFSNSFNFEVLANLFFSVFLLLYFFQGVSIAVNYLNKYLKKFPFVQIFILFTIVTTAFSFLSLIGFFDVFFDFRKKMKNIKNKGELKWK